MQLQVGHLVFNSYDSEVTITMCEKGIMEVA